MPPAPASSSVEAAVAMWAGMKIGSGVSGTGMVIPGGWLWFWFEEEDWARAAEAEGLERVKVRIAVMIAEVRFSKL